MYFCHKIKNCCCYFKNISTLFLCSVPRLAKKHSIDKLWRIFDHWLTDWLIDWLMEDVGPGGEGDLRPPQDTRAAWWVSVACCTGSRARAAGRSTRAPPGPRWGQGWPEASPTLWWCCCRGSLCGEGQATKLGLRGWGGVTLYTGILEKFNLRTRTYTHTSTL